MKLTPDQRRAIQNVLDGTYCPCCDDCLVVPEDEDIKVFQDMLEQDGRA